ncbi:MAG: hypothetical protein ACPGWR_20880 [Ardenticatenaceae bacterium]
MSHLKSNQLRSYTDQVFAPLDDDHRVDRFAGGNESEVYLTDDRRYVIKIKSDLASDLPTALQWARLMRDVAQEPVDCLGPLHTIPSYYVLSRDDAGQVQVLLIQPFMRDARQLFEVDYASLNRAERTQVAQQLRYIIHRSVISYFQHGHMPDLYGRTSTSPDERKRLNAPYMLPWRVWSFLVKRNLLRAHNLLLTDAPQRRIVLVDYDPVRRSKLYRRIYYTVRLLLFIRDWLLIWWMQWTGKVPGR